jgi:predicted transcriptional regulator
MEQVSAVQDERCYANDREAVLALLRQHRGRHNPITSRAIARHLHLATREVRQIIADLVQEGELIGASVNGAAGGYYVIEDEADLEETRAILQSRATEIFARDRALCAAWTRKSSRPLQPLLPTMGGAG